MRSSNAIGCSFLLWSVCAFVICKRMSSSERCERLNCNCAYRLRSVLRSVTVTSSVRHRQHALTRLLSYWCSSAAGLSCFLQRKKSVSVTKLLRLTQEDPCQLCLVSYCVSGTSIFNCYGGLLKSIEAKITKGASFDIQAWHGG